MQIKEIEEFEWNACQSLFDTHVAATVPEALQYMGNNFAFFIPVMFWGSMLQVQHCV